MSQIAANVEENFDDLGMKLNCQFENEVSLCMGDISLLGLCLQCLY